ncbi:MAG: hypothetical protein OEX00_09680, partial [Gammaproteobacteria bacterium]|nr:hypothetical protein [Gammaproteobacteria bacterium]MDH5692793.1 hypothetical protein [Gammaproteobacteria bacterium]
DGGSLDVDPGEYAYVESVNAEPVFIETTNDLFNDDPTSLSQSTGDSSSDWGVWGGATQAMGMLASNEDLTGGNVFEATGVLATKGSVVYKATIPADVGYTVVTGASFDTLNSKLDVNFDNQTVNATIAINSGSGPYYNWVATANDMNIVDGSFSGGVDSLFLEGGDRSGGGFSGSVSGSFNGSLDSVGIPSDATVDYHITDTASTTEFFGTQGFVAE